MATKVISTRDFADIKRMAQIVNPKVTRKATLLKQKAKIDKEIAELDEAISLLEGGIKVKFLGLGTEQLIKKVVVPSVKEDGTLCLDAKTGKPLSKTTWEPLEEHLKYNEEKNNYVITIAEEGVPAGSDYDADAARLAEEEAAQSAFEAEIAEGENNPFGM